MSRERKTEPLTELQDLQVAYLALGDVRPSPTNARTHPRKQVDQIAASIAAFGFTNPILVDPERNIIAGQKRLRVLRGTGKVLVCFTPYWNEHMYKMMTGTSIEQSIFE